MTDRTRPGLVTFYDIRPGNRAGLFLEPRNPHRAAHPTVSAFYSSVFQNCVGYYN